MLFVRNVQNDHCHQSHWKANEEWIILCNNVGFDTGTITISQLPSYHHSGYHYVQNAQNVQNDHCHQSHWKSNEEWIILCNNVGFDTGNITISQLPSYHHSGYHYVQNVQNVQNDHCHQSHWKANEELIILCNNVGFDTGNITISQLPSYHHSGYH